MKKVLLFASCALFVAAMSVACSKKAVEEPAQPEQENTEEQIQEQAPEQEVAPVATDAAASSEADAAMLAAAKEAGQAKCNCYKKDAASVEACFRAILSEKYAQYQDNEAFKNALDAEFQSCVKAKVEAAVQDKVNEGIGAAANAAAGMLNKK